MINDLDYERITFPVYLSDQKFGNSMALLLISD